MTILAPGELLTAIRLPATWSGAQFSFEKIRDRNVWDFALVSVAAAMVGSGRTIDRLRLVANGVAAQPWRLTRVEDAVRGKARTKRPRSWPDRSPSKGAQPLAHNAYKIPLLRNLVKRAIMGDVSPT